MDDIKRIYNWFRIRWLRIFRPDKVKTIRVQDVLGRQHEVTMERQEEKVCAHTTITEIAPTLWKCTGCEDYYCMITYRVHVPYMEVVKYAEKIAQHLGATLRDTEPNDSPEAH